ncbi:MAG: CPBP family intramembrane metalloprotease [Methanomassiliicoccaceae archaeon]|nr:CPBP family intramembrane metalloprotease [Methanomassiliicoccaceae archaeon]
MSEDRCDRCNESLACGHSYCVKCGRPLGYVAGASSKADEKSSGLSGIIRMVGVIVLLMCVPFLFFEVFTMFWVMDGIISNIGDYLIPILFLTPSPIALGYIHGIVAQSYYIFLVVAVLVSFIIIMYDSREGLKELFESKINKVTETPIYAVVTLFAATIAFNIILNMFLVASGNEPKVPDIWDDPNYEPWMLHYDLLNASVWEEVLCRVLMIGLPLMLLGVMRTDKAAWKRLFGRFEMDRAAVILIIVSSAIFAYAHMGGWDALKIIPTFVTGLALGYLFVKYGVHAAIMLHFLVDYSSAPIWVFGDDMGEPMVLLFILGVVFFGAALFVWYLIRSVRFTRDMVSKPQHRP